MEKMKINNSNIDSIDKIAYFGKSKLEKIDNKDVVFVLQNVSSIQDSVDAGETTFVLRQYIREYHTLVTIDKLPGHFVVTSANKSDEFKRFIVLYNNGTYDYDTDDVNKIITDRSFYKELADALDNTLNVIKKDRYIMDHIIHGKEICNINESKDENPRDSSTDDAPTFTHW
jgi:hypothetical protein